MAFAWRQTPGLFDRSIIEWDARALALAAYRFHGGTLFARDLGIDAAAKYGTPLWSAIYWLGTLLTDPVMVSKLLPFALLAVVVWQGYALGRSMGGPLTGALCVLTLVHCTFVWNRLVGGHARGFGFPLTIALLRYAIEGREHRALLVLVLQGLAYPSSLLCAGPAYVISRRDRASVLRAIAATTIGVACAGVALWHDPKLGGAPTYAQAAGLRQMQALGAQPYYPLPPFLVMLRGLLPQPFRADGGWWQGFSFAPWVLLAVFGVCMLVHARDRMWQRGGAAILLALPITGIAAGVVAHVLAYRLYLPDRMVQQAWYPAALLGLPLAVLAVAKVRMEARRLVLVAIAYAVLLFAVGGDGLVAVDNLTPVHRYDSPAIRFVGTLPERVLVATHPERSTYVQLFAKRSVLFSAALNVPFLYEYALELDRRMEAFYRAYYAVTPPDVVALRTRYGVDYLIVDKRDFGPDALKRSRYFEPWGSLNAQLLSRVDASTLALAHPPASAVVFETAEQSVIDLAAYEKTR